MTRNDLNVASGVAGILLPIAALSIVLIVVTTGWERHLSDEGIAAHLFQLLMVVEAFVVPLFILTADRARTGVGLSTIALQVACWVIAFASVRVFGL